MGAEMCLVFAGGGCAQDPRRCIPTTKGRDEDTSRQGATEKCGRQHEPYLHTYVSAIVLYGRIGSMFDIRKVG